MPNVSITSVPRGDPLELPRGDTWTITFQRVGDISGRDKLWFTLKDDLSDTDAESWVRIEETIGLEYIDGTAAATPANGSITVTDAVVGDFTVGLEAEESAKLNDIGNLFYDAQDLEGTDITTRVRGRAIMIGDVAKVVS